MAFQKGFFGVGIAGQDTGSKQLVSALGSLNKNLQKYGEYVGTELDKEVKAEAEKVARIDNFKSYQDAVDSGEIDATKSDFYIAAYDNIKGKTAGIEYNTKKRIAFETWFADMTNSDDDDVDGQQYMQWSEQYDRDYMNQMGEYSTHFHRGFDPFVAMSSQQLSSKYASANATRLKEKGKLNLQLIVESSLKNNANDLDKFEPFVNELNLQTDAFRFVSKTDFNSTVVQAAKNVVAEIANKNDINSDYDLAIDVMEKIKNFKRPNGSRLLSGKDIEKWENDIEKLRGEKIDHDNRITEIARGAYVDSFVKDQLKAVQTAFFNSDMNDAQLQEGRNKHALMMIEWNSRWVNYLRTHQGAPTDEVLLNARIYAEDLKNKYLYSEVNEIQNYTRNSKFNVLGRLSILSKDYQQLVYDENKNQIRNDNDVVKASELKDPVVAQLLRQRGYGTSSKTGLMDDYTFTIKELELLQREYKEWKTINFPDRK